MRSRHIPARTGRAKGDPAADIMSGGHVRQRNWWGHPDVVRRNLLDPRLEPGIDDRRALGLGIQMMGRSAGQHDPPLALLRIDLVGLDGDLVIGVRDTGAQVLVKDGVPRAQDK